VNRKFQLSRQEQEVYDYICTRTKKTFNATVEDDTLPKANSHLRTDGSRDEYDTIKDDDLLLERTRHVSTLSVSVNRSQGNPLDDKAPKKIRIIVDIKALVLAKGSLRKRGA